MKSMNRAKEGFTAPPPGRYKVRLNSVEASTAASSGASMLKVSGEVIEPEEFAGSLFFDNILTDGEAKGAGFGKKKLRGLGIDVDTDVETADEALAQQLTGVETWADCDNQPRYSKNPATGKYDVPVTQIVEGKQVQVQNLTIDNYLGALNTTAAASTPAVEAKAPAAQAAPAAQVAQQTAPPPWKVKAVANAAAAGAKK